MACVFNTELQLMKSARTHKQNVKDFRPSASTRGYDAKWRKARDLYLKSHPLCVDCLRCSIIRAATVVDHIEPHRGVYEKFWDESNWQALCEQHHNSKTGKGL